MPRIAELPQVRGFLRRATSRMHHSIDQGSVLTILANPDVTLQLYSTAMRALARAYLDIDFNLSQSGPLCPAGVPAYAPRIPTLASDLNALHEVLQTSPQVKAQAFPPPASEAAYLGMRYVVEGAQLGSRVIHKNLRQVFGEGLREFGSFWTPDSALQTSWPSVLQGLARVQTRDSLAAAARAARLTFRHLELHLAGN